MKDNIFGTDGIRGKVGGEVVNEPFFTRLGRAVGIYISKTDTGLPPLALIGRDTRASGKDLAEAFALGLKSSGMTVRNLGILPTPAVAMAVPHSQAALGAMITASHNSASDNGIKLFSSKGLKLDESCERQITKLVNDQTTLPLDDSKTETEFESESGFGAKYFYLKSLESLFLKGCLKDWKIVIDMANGAACETAPLAFGRLGAEMILIGDTPDGENINTGCGSEHPRALAARVLAEKANLGISFDGDGDRLVLCDETGSILDGDETMALLALHALRRGDLSEKTVVVSVMSNLGLDKALITNTGARVERVAVGDRNVVEKMLETGCSLGGESSGHIIFSDHFLTADGLYASLKVMEVMRETGIPLSRLRRCVTLYPQIQRNYQMTRKIPLEEIPALHTKISEMEKEMSDEGRLLLRYSGTEPLLRLLVEGPDRQRLDGWAARIENAIAENLPLR